MKIITASEMRTKFSEVYQSVRYQGEPVAISHHGDDSVIMLRRADLYPAPSPEELALVAAGSGAFDDLTNDTVTYE